MDACFRAMKAALLLRTGKSPAATREADADCDRAVEILKKAVAAGLCNLPEMQRDPDRDLRPRNREDFKQLLAELKANEDKYKTSVHRPAVVDIRNRAFRGLAELSSHTFVATPKKRPVYGNIDREPESSHPDDRSDV